MAVRRGWKVEDYIHSETFFFHKSVGVQIGYKTADNIRVKIGIGKFQFSAFKRVIENNLNFKSLDFPPNRMYGYIHQDQFYQQIFLTNLRSHFSSVLTAKWK